MTKLLVYENYESLSAAAAEDVFQMIQKKPGNLLCTASGDSPAGLYQKLVEKVKKNNTDVSKLNFVGLDEWMNMNGNDEGSCRFHLNDQLFHPLKISENKIAFLDGRASSPDSECRRIDNFIKKHDVINLAIVGLGMNGHVGMNEPGTSALLHSHVAEIDAVTQKFGQKYFKEKKEISLGLTLGIANLMEAENVILIVSGKKKAKIVKRVLEEEISEKLPASLLRNHSSFSVYLDAEAASLLIKKI